VSASSSPSTTPWGSIPFDALPDAEDTARARILDLAFVRFCEVGIAATTMSQIAADAGISRQWLYRYFENRDAVVTALLGRESRRFVGELMLRDRPDAAFVDVVIDAFDFVVGALRSHPLLQRIVLTEPETVAPFLASGTGPLLQVAAETAIVAIRRRTSLTPAEARAVAETLLRLVLSVVVNNHTTIDFDDARQRRAYAQRIIPRLLAPG
jgi:AcrR family transcriptional regulator